MENGDVFIGRDKDCLRRNSFGKGWKHFLDKSEGIKDPVKANIVRTYN